jgi:hypothetical protein
MEKMDANAEEKGTEMDELGEQPTVCKRKRFCIISDLVK